MGCCNSRSPGPRAIPPPGSRWRADASQCGRKKVTWPDKLVVLVMSRRTWQHPGTETIDAFPNSGPIDILLRLRQCHPARRADAVGISDPLFDRDLPGDIGDQLRAERFTARLTGLSAGIVQPVMHMSLACRSPPPSPSRIAGLEFSGRQGRLLAPPGFVHSVETP